MNDILISRKNIYNHRKFQELSTSTKNTVKFGMETISYRGQQLRILIPDNIKSEPTLELLKKKIRKWKCEPCPCRICKTYLQHIGFRLYYLMKLSGSILPMVCTNLFYFVLKRCIWWGRGREREWQSILISYYLQYLEV